jgi:hypothetical protein
VIVPRRRPAPEWGGTASPASSWRRQDAQNEGILSGGYRSPFEGEEGELASEVNAPVRKLDNGGGSVAFRCGRGAATTGVGDGNLQQHVLDKPLAIPRIKKKERRNQSFTGGDEFTAAAGTRGGGAGGIGSRVRVLVCCGGKGEGRSLNASLNRSKGKKAKGGGRTPSGGACHWWPRPSRLGFKDGR